MKKYMARTVLSSKGCALFSGDEWRLEILPSEPSAGDWDSHGLSVVSFESSGAAIRLYGVSTFAGEEAGVEFVDGVIVLTKV